MPRFKVNGQIEYNGTLYIPFCKDALKFAPTSGARTEGGSVPVNSTGFIDMSDAEAKALSEGVVEAVPESKSAAKTRASASAAAAPEPESTGTVKAASKK